jgi:hypothetical protein
VHLLIITLFKLNAQPQSKVKTNQHFHINTNFISIEKSSFIDEISCLVRQTRKSEVKGKENIVIILNLILSLDSKKI